MLLKAYFSLFPYLPTYHLFFEGQEGTLLEKVRSIELNAVDLGKGKVVD